MSQPNLWGFDPDQVGGQVGNNHPSTSLKAAIKVKSGSQKAQALLALYDSDGLTAYDLSKLVINNSGESISANQAATRIGELREQDLAAYLFDQFGRPVEKPTTPGNTGFAHVLTYAGREAATTLKISCTQFVPTLRQAKYDYKR